MSFFARCLAPAFGFACLAATICSCGGRGSTARIGYAYPAAAEASKMIAILQGEIDGWHRRRIAEIFPARFRPGLTGYAAEVDVAETLILTPDLSAVVGHLSSRSSLLVAPIYQDAGIPLIVPTGTTRRLRDLGPLVFSMAPDEDAEGEFITAFAVDRLGARRITVFYLYGDEYGIGLRDGVVSSLGKRSLAPADQVGILEDSDFPKIVAASIKRAVPDGVVVAGRNLEAAGIISALHTLLPDVPVVAGDGVVLSKDYGDTLGRAANGVFAVAFWHPNLATDTSRAFMTRWRAKPGPDPTGPCVMFYDALKLLAQAIREVGSRPSSIRKYLAELGVTRPPYPAVAGPISFAPGRPTNLVMTHFSGGEVAIAGSR